MANWIDSLSEESIFFITPDVKRGLGVENILPHYHIICSSFDPIIPVIRSQGAKVFCLEEELEGKDERLNNSGKILEHPFVTHYIQKNRRGIPRIMYFKPSVKLDYVINKQEFYSIGNNFKLNEEFENKIKFHEKIKRVLPESVILSVFELLKKADYKEITNKLGEEVVVQFGHGWAGGTTYFIKSGEEFNKLASQYPDTFVRISKRIPGFSVLNNCCIYRDSILVGPPAIQISGIDILCPNPAVTCGRQWPVYFLDRDQIGKINKYSLVAGHLLKQEEFRGFFGLDFIVDCGNGNIYINEINARLTASSAFYTKLELAQGHTPFIAYHIASFTNRDLPLTYKPDEYRLSGSQITFRSDFEGTALAGLDDFGVFKINGKTPELTKKEYYPQNLKDGEFVFIRRIKKEEKSRNEEKARIETREQVLETSDKLKDWVSDLLV